MAKPGSMAVLDPGIEEVVFLQFDSKLMAKYLLLV